MNPSTSSCNSSNNGLPIKLIFLPFTSPFTPGYNIFSSPLIYFDSHLNLEIILKSAKLNKSSVIAFNSPPINFSKLFISRDLREYEFL